MHTGKPNQLIGFVRLRDLAEACATDHKQSAPQLIRQAVTTDPSALAIDVLRDMQQHRRHLTIVVNGDGTAQGIVTVEDIVEELLGEIDEPDPLESHRRLGRVR